MSAIYLATRPDRGEVTFDEGEDRLAGVRPPAVLRGPRRAGGRDLD